MLLTGKSRNSLVQVRFAIAMGLWLFAAAVSAGQWEPVNLPADSVVTNERARFPDVTPDGRYAAFLLDRDIATGVADDGLLYRIDRQTGEALLATDPFNLSTNPPFRVSISDDGRRVSLNATVRTSPPPVQIGAGVWVRDLVDGDWILGSAGDGGDTSHLQVFDEVDGELSADGSFVVFASESDGLIPEDSDGTLQVFVHDLQTLETRLIGGLLFRDPNLRAIAPEISADMSVAAFLANDPDLLPEKTGSVMDLFLRDLATDTLVRASVGPTGEEAMRPTVDYAISENADLVLFRTDAAAFEVGGEMIQPPYLYDHALQTSSPIAGEFEDRAMIINQVGDLAGGGRYFTFFGQYFPLADPVLVPATGWYLADRQNNQVARLEPVIDGDRVSFFEEPILLLDPPRVVFVTDDIVTEPLAVAYEYTPGEIDLSVAATGPNSISTDFGIEETYQVVVTNHSTSDALDVVITLLQDNFQIRSAPPECDQAVFDVTVPDPDFYNCLAGDIAAGATHTVTITARAFNPGFGSDFGFVARAQARGDFVTDPNRAMTEKRTLLVAPVDPGTGGTNSGGGGGGATGLLVVLFLVMLQRRRRTMFVRELGTGHRR